MPAADGSGVPTDALPVPVAETPAAAAPPQGAWRSEPEVRALQARTVRILALIQMIGGIGVGVSASSGPLLAEDVAGSPFLAGVARTSLAVGAALIALPLAGVAGRFGRRRALTLGWTTAAIGGAVLVIAAVTRNIPVLVLGMLAFGSGSATALQTRYAATDLATPQHRGRDLSTVVWAVTIGAVAGPNLTAPGQLLARALGLPDLSGGFLIGGTAAAAAALVGLVVLRPDPLLVGRRRDLEALDLHDPTRTRAPSPRRGIRATFRLVVQQPAALFGMVVVVVAQGVMTAVMTMSPVFMRGEGATLTIVGVSLSLHIFGMYALSPIVGRITDRFGAVPSVIVSHLLFFTAALFGYLSGQAFWSAVVGLLLLGLAWSFSFVAGSALIAGAFTDSAQRATVQGTTDTAVNVVAAVAAALAGPGMALMGYGGLNLLAIVPCLPMLVWSLRRARGGS